MDRLISLVAAAMAVDGRIIARSAKRNAVVAVILFFLFLAAFVSGVAALAIYLAEKFGPLGATLRSPSPRSRWRCSSSPMR